MVAIPAGAKGSIRRLAVKPGQSLARSVRLTQIQHFLHKNPLGLTTKELAKLCAVCTRTIQRDLLALQSDLDVPITQEGDRYGILDSYILPPLSFSLYEAMALFLASRLVLRQTDESNPHIQTALTKLSGVLPPALAERLKESIQVIGNKPSNPDYIHIFDQVAIAWSTQRRMRICYQSLQSVEAKEWLLAPYFIEVTGVGYSAYVIGHGEHGDKKGITTFKLDRIKEAELLEEGFEIPEGLNLEKLLGSSWGVMWGDDTEVKLKFSARVSRRVKESVWHLSQRIEDLPDGGCLFTVRVGSTLEMTPWIRGWGPDVEVLAPVPLRKEFADYAHRLREIYI
jgi:predicted DNA-binding transcriptional regulator YafY